VLHSNQYLRCAFADRATPSNTI